jgi:activator of HSP90 ATPase
MTENITLSVELFESPEKLYKAWLSSSQHSKFTDGKAKINPEPGGEFTAWDDYISGKTIELEPYSRIVQTWRTTEFAASTPDSRLEILFEPFEQGTKLTLIHTNIPEGTSKEYEQGWIDFYFTPMKEYFVRKK